MTHQRQHIRKFFKNLEHYGGIVDGNAVLLVYNKKRPELSRILIEPL